MIRYSALPRSNGVKNGLVKKHAGIRTKTKGKVLTLTQIFLYRQKIRQEDYTIMKHGTQSSEKRYKLDFLVEPFAPISGTVAEVAREYCKIEGITLYIMPQDDVVESVGDLALYARCPAISPNELIFVAPFEDTDDYDLESGYRSFFKEYLRADEHEEPRQWRITRLDKVRRHDHRRSNRVSA